MTDQYQAGTRVSEYVLEERIGAGSFGEVWRARHHIWDGEAVAIKLPTEPDYVRYLRKEGLVVHGLRHTNIVGVKGLDPYAEIPYLVMELIQGPALREVIDKHPGGLPLPVVETVLYGVLAGLQVAHDASVLHRDLKPGNVLLHLPEGRLEDLGVDDVKLSDFGLGSGATDTLRSLAQSASLDRDNRLVGTLAYMAPELREGTGQADPRSDLYALGVMLFEMLTGERPAGTEMPSDLRDDRLPAAYDDLFRKLYTRRDRRIASAAEVLDFLGKRLAPAAVSAGVGLPPLPNAGRRAAPVSAGASGGKCPQCQAQVEPYDQFCTQCRHQLVAQVRICPSCGAYPGPADKFCIFCGLKLPDQ